VSVSEIERRSPSLFARLIGSCATSAMGNCTITATQISRTQYNGRRFINHLKVRLAASLLQSPKP
jgi:hypothetical protein